MTNKFFKKEEEDSKGKEEGKKRVRKRKTGWSSERMGRWFLLFLMIVQSVVGVNLPSANAQRRTDGKDAR